MPEEERADVGGRGGDGVADPRDAPVIVAEHLGTDLAIAEDSTHVYWVTRGRRTEQGIWRVEKCR